MRSEREGSKKSHAAPLAGAPGFGGAAAEDGARQGYLLPAQGDDRASLRRRKGEICNALYAAQRSDPSDTLNSSLGIFLGSCSICGCAEARALSRRAFLRTFRGRRRHRSFRRSRRSFRSRRSTLRIRPCGGARSGGPAPARQPERLKSTIPAYLLRSLHDSISAM